MQCQLCVRSIITDTCTISQDPKRRIGQLYLEIYICLCHTIVVNLNMSRIDR